jgi:pyruvate dehydrogenase E1 component beta subunit
MKGPVPEGEHIVPIGKANVARTGKDVTIVSYSLMMHRALEAAEKLVADGISAECIDLRTISPLDTDTVFESLRKTKRLVIVHEAVKQGGVGAELAARAAEEMIDWLDAPIRRIGAPFVPVPFSPPLEQLIKISADDIVRTVKEICR